MSNIIFTNEELQTLLNNPWVKSATTKSIIFTTEFKIHFINQYNVGIKPKEIFASCGFNIKVLGDKRIEQCTARFKQMNLRPEGFEDTRKQKSGRVKSPREITLEEENEILRKKNLQLQQELEFLKKMEFLARQVKSTKSKQ